MKEAITKIIDKRKKSANKTLIPIENADLKPGKIAKLKDMDLEEVTQIDNMLHQIIIKRIKNKKNPVSQAQSTGSSKRSVHIESIESELSPLIESNNLPLLERYYKCGGSSQLDFIPMKRQIINALPALPFNLFKQKKTGNVKMATNRINGYTVCID